MAVTIGWRSLWQQQVSVWWRQSCSRWSVLSPTGFRNRKITGLCLLRPIRCTGGVQSVQWVKWWGGEGRVRALEAAGARGWWGLPGCPWAESYCLGRSWRVCRRAVSAERTSGLHLRNLTEERGNRKQVKISVVRMHFNNMKRSVVVESSSQSNIMEMGHCCLLLCDDEEGFSPFISPQRYCFCLPLFLDLHSVVFCFYRYTNFFTSAKHKTFCDFSRFFEFNTLNQFSPLKLK